MRGLDYSSGRPSAAAVKAAGFGFVMRYIGTPGRTKNLTAREYDDMHNSGVAVGLVYEDSAGTALKGHARGAQDAGAVLADARNIGVQVHACYFAVDFDVTNASQMATVDDYLAGAASVLGAGAVGVYGEADVIDHCLANGRARYGWQTRAWSHGRTSTRAHVIQQLEQTAVGGVLCDVNESVATDFGQAGIEEDGMNATELTAWVGNHDNHMSLRQIAAEGAVDAINNRADVQQVIRAQATAAVAPVLAKLDSVTSGIVDVPALAAAVAEHLAPNIATAVADALAARLAE